MKVLHIQNSYQTWDINTMYLKILGECFLEYHSTEVDIILNRSYTGMYIEWYLHNIGYFLTLPFIKNENIKALNERFKHLDLEEHK